MTPIKTDHIAPRQFSLKVYLLLIILFSWPFQIVYLILGEAFRPILLLSMIMVAVGTFICGKYIFKDGFQGAGWHWGRPKHYLFAFLLALFLWFFPSVVEQVFNWYTPLDQINYSDITTTFIISFVITIIPAFSEEFGWRGYLLPRLLNKYSTRKALLLHGLVTWIWHLPFILDMGLNAGENSLIYVPMVMIVSFIPTILHAIVFAYLWSRTASLAVATFYHVCFDEVRDTLEETIGLGTFAQNWQMLVLTILGVWLLFMGKWYFKNINTMDSL
ncbi:MAG: type II CAAX endopeptidase family protein [Fulvivirga sp.]|uniref:CPBP family intramembrane glutamic endopeptidase n=1 Tax=Fulvivirga sp. TaxID=1931237 RepID=UPI0032EB895D